MKLKTSYFNLTVLKKDLTRFSPVWGLYGIFQLLFVLLVWGDENNPVRFAINAADVTQGMGVLNFVYAGLCGFLLFGDLFRPRMCNMLHALPMRREGWFLTHLASGLLFCLLPNLAGTLLASLLLQQYAYGAFLWLTLMTLQYLFFFGCTVFAVMCAGNALGGMAVYGLFNFLAALAAWLIVTFYEPLLFGVKINAEQIALRSPVLGFTGSQYFDFRYADNRSVAAFTFIPEDWVYLLWATAVGIALLGLALWIYRSRNLENAGDLIALKPVAPVFLVLYTLCLGAVMHFVAEAFTNGLQYVFLLIGFAIGFFTGKMLLEKKVNVFRLKTAAQFGILVAAFVVSVVLTVADPFGVTRYVPNPENITFVCVSPYSSPYYIENESCYLSEPEDIARITDLHRELVENRRPEGEENVFLRYQTKAGVIVERQYPVSLDSDVAKVLKEYYSSPECIFGTADLEYLLRACEEISFYPSTETYPHIRLTNGAIYFGEDMEAKFDGKNYRSAEPFTTSREAKGLFDALMADCLAGNLTQHWRYSSSDYIIGNVSFSYRTGENTYRNKDISVYANCKNTVEFLKDLAANTETK